MSSKNSLPPIKITRPDMVGMLTTKSSGGLFRKNKATAQYYVLKDSDLFVFEQEGDETPVAFMVLDGAKLAKDGTEGKSFVLMLANGTSETYSTEKQRDMTNWMLALQTGIELEQRSQSDWDVEGYPASGSAAAQNEEEEGGSGSSSGGGTSKPKQSAAQLAQKRLSRTPAAIEQRNRLDNEMDILASFGGLVDLDGSGRTSSAAASGMLFDPLAMALGDTFNTSGAVPTNREIEDMKHASGMGRSATTLESSSRRKGQLSDFPPPKQASSSSAGLEQESVNSMGRSATSMPAHRRGLMGGKSQSTSAVDTSSLEDGSGGNGKAKAKPKLFKRASSMLFGTDKTNRIPSSEEMGSNAETRQYSTSGKFPPVTYDKPDLSGFLNKEGGNVKNIKTRYFVLKDSDLFYFKREEDRVPLGFIMVDKCRLFKPKRKWSRAHGFALENAKGRTYYIFTKDQEEMTEWMLALEHARLSARRSMSHWDVPGYTDEYTEAARKYPRLNIDMPEAREVLDCEGGELETLRPRVVVVAMSDLFVFRDEKDASPLTFLLLEQCTIQDSPEGVDSPHCISLQANSEAKPLLLHLPDEDTKLIWLSLLEDAAELGGLRAIPGWRGQGYPIGVDGTADEGALISGDQEKAQSMLASGKLPSCTIQHPDKSGWLHKEAGGLKKDRKYWFVLKNSDLLYYENTEDVNPLAYIKLDYCDISLPSDRAFDEYALRLSWARENVVWMLKAADSQELTEWLLALEDARDMKTRALIGWEVNGYEDGEMDGLLPEIKLFNVDKSGPMTQHLGSGFKKRARWVELKESDLFVFEMRYDRNPLLFFKLEDCKIAVPPNMAEQHGFEIRQSDQHIFHFSLGSAEDMAEWLLALEEGRAKCARVSDSWSAPGYLTDEGSESKQALGGKLPAIIVDSPDKVGWMYKEGGTWKNLARRYFVLKDSDLFYFKDRNDVNPTGFIEMDQCRILVPKEKMQRPFGFQLQWRDHKKFNLFAESAEQLTEWMLAMNEAKELGKRYKEDWGGYEHKQVEDTHVNPPVFITEPDWTGYLEVATDKRIERGGTPKQIVRMYLVLKKSDLFVFTDDEETRPEHFMLVDYCTISVYPTTQLYSFHVANAAGGKSLYLFASNAGDMSEWLTALETARKLGERSQEDWGGVGYMDAEAGAGVESGGTGASSSWFSSNSEIPAVTIRQPEKAGWMLVGTNNARNLKKRWCVLKKSDIFIFKDSVDEAPIGFVLLDEAQLFMVDKQELGLDEGVNVIGVKWLHQVFFFVTESGRELLEWAMLMESGRLNRMRAIQSWPGYGNLKWQKNKVKSVDELVKRYRAETVVGSSSSSSGSSTDESSSSGGSGSDSGESGMSRVRRGTVILGNSQKNQELGEAIAVLSKQELQQGKDFDEVTELDALLKSVLKSTKKAKGASEVETLHKNYLEAMEATQVCTGCNEAIMDLSECVQLFGTTWHREHLMCSNCGRSNAIHEHEGDAFCARCYKQVATAPRCVVCAQFITTEVHTLFKGYHHFHCIRCDGCGNQVDEVNKQAAQVFCNACNAEYLQHICTRCGKSTQDTPKLYFRNSPYHVDCWKCKLCQRRLGKQVFAHGEKVYCEGCTMRLDMDFESVKVLL